jgi:hypothetical protein
MSRKRKFGNHSSRTLNTDYHTLEIRNLMADLATDHLYQDIMPSPGMTTGVTTFDVGSDGQGPRVGRIINGTITNAYPSVGLIGDTNGMHCTASLIAPQYVLTAAHCLEGIGHAQGRFQVGGQTYSSSRIFIHPQYNPNAIGSDSAHDIAIMKLDRPVTNVTPSSIFRGTPTVGQMLTLVGFGEGGNASTGGDGTFGIKRVGTTPIDSVSSRLIHWNFDNNNESNTAPGDSGGPAFVTINGQQFIAGVTSGGTLANAAIGDQSFDTRVDAYKSWIDSIVGTGGNGTVISIRPVDGNASERLPSQTADPGVFSVSRTGPTTSSLTVNLSVSGTATNGVDYVSIPTKVVIPAGQASATVRLDVNDDTRVEGTETAVLKVAAGTGYSIDPGLSSATISILDNDAATWNNNFANRPIISGTNATATGTNVGATAEAGEPNVLGISGGKSIWYSWTAGVSGQVVLSTLGSNFDTTLGVYTGSSVNALQHIQSNDDQNLWQGIYTSRLTFSATAGRTYQILVDGYEGDRGNVRLTLSQTVNRASQFPGGNSVFAAINRTEPVRRPSGEFSRFDVFYSAMNAANLQNSRHLELSAASDVQDERDWVPAANYGRSQYLLAFGSAHTNSSSAFVSDRGVFDSSRGSDNDEWFNDRFDSSINDEALADLLCEAWEDRFV